MGSRSKSTHRGEAWVPSDVLDVLLAGAGAKAPTHDQANTAREVAHRLRKTVQPHYVAAARLRAEPHLWSPKEAAEPWAIVLTVEGGGRVYVIPKSKRRADPSTLKQLAVPLAFVVPQDDEDRADQTQDWVPLGNSGNEKRAPTHRLPAWTKLHFESAAADWLKEGIAAAMQPSEKRAPLLPPSARTNIVVGYAYDLCRYWCNPDTRPDLTRAFDQSGELRPADEGTPTPETLAAWLALESEAWNEAQAVDAERPKGAAPDGQAPDGQAPESKPAADAKLGDEA